MRAFLDYGVEAYQRSRASHWSAALLLRHAFLVCRTDKDDVAVRCVEGWVIVLWDPVLHSWRTSAKEGFFSFNFFKRDDAIVA